MLAWWGCREGSVEASGPGRPEEVTLGSEGEQAEKRFSRPRRTSTGGLKNLPVMAPANEQISHALRAIERVKVRISGDTFSDVQIYVC